MKRFPRQQNVRVVASSQASSAGIPMFLAFERRAADPAAQFRFHLVSAGSNSNDPALERFVEKAQARLTELIKERTHLTEELIHGLLETSMPSGDDLMKLGICNEEPQPDSHPANTMRRPE